MDLEKIKLFLRKNLLATCSIAVALISVVGSATYVYMNKCEECPVCEENTLDEIAYNGAPEKEEKEEIKIVKVDVKGAVKKPGVYGFSEGMTINDAILQAGGIATNGTTKNINLSKKLTDEMVVYVFTKNELKVKESKNEIVCEIPKCECETIKVENNAENVNGSSHNSSGNAVSSGKVSINNGTLEELMTLSGVGESKAKSIIEYREKNGKFENLEDLKKVSGIGDAAYEKIKNQITL